MFRFYFFFYLALAAFIHLKFIHSILWPPPWMMFGYVPLLLLLFFRHLIFWSARTMYKKISHWNWPYYYLFVSIGLFLQTPINDSTNTGNLCFNVVGFICIMSFETRMKSRNININIIMKTAHAATHIQFESNSKRWQKNGKRANDSLQFQLLNEGQSQRKSI